MKYSDSELTREFYIYGIFTTEDGLETLRYVGKGQRVKAGGRVIYDRVSHYTNGKRAIICKHLREKLNELDRTGTTYTVRVIQECPDEASAFAAEAATVAQQTGLWNLTTGGSSGWTLRPESRLKMSLSRLGKSIGKMSVEARQALSRAKRGKRLTLAHRANIKQGLARASRCDKRIHFDPARLVAKPRRQPYNALLSPAAEVDFLKVHNGQKTASELQVLLGVLAGKPVSVTGIYSLINRYGGKAVHTFEDRLARREARIRAIVNRRCAARQAALNLVRAS